MELPKLDLSSVVDKEHKVFLTYAIDNTDETDDYKGLYDSCCALCDDGGDVLVCKGTCMRCFHPTVKSGISSFCQSLGFKNSAESKSIENFLCNNCQLQQHQCFLCGKLGSSNKSSTAEVYRCCYATCGYYYHPACLANYVSPGDEFMTTQFTKQIAAAKPFTCPIHRCSWCGGVEKPNIYALQFATCRRCPKSYHCYYLPHAISSSSSSNWSINQRTWDNLLHKRILMYCTKHQIVPSLQTPRRNHLLFPYMERKTERSTSTFLLSKRSNPFGNSKHDVPGTSLFARSPIYGQSHYTSHAA